jgi:hypothetical protein
MTFHSGTVATGSPAAGSTNATGTAAPAQRTDDEILGIVLPRTARRGEALSDATGFGDDESSGGPLNGDRDSAETVDIASATNGKDAELRDSVDAAVEANPELKRLLESNPLVRGALLDAAAYKDVFKTPDAARQARELIADVNRLDTLFYSRRPEDHAELARAVAALDKDAFAMLARSMAELAGKGTAETGSSAAPRTNSSSSPARAEEIAHPVGTSERGAMNAAQREFMQATNAAAVESVVSEIESQVSKLLPEGIAKAARNRVVGEIYREMDTALRGNRALTAQIQNAFRSGRLDADQQQALVGLITARAKQALPGVAKRVMSEWTSTMMTLNQERRARQRNAERRVDIAGTGGAATGGRRAVSSKDIDYGRMSDADILNL